MLSYIKKYVYFELLLGLLLMNMYFSLRFIYNVAVVTYLSVLGIVYLFFKFRYSGLKRKRDEDIFLDKHVLIIGGSEGIGFALGKRILKEKPKILTLMGRNVNKLKNARDALLTEIGNDSENIYLRNYLKINIFKCDVSRFEDVECAIDKATNCKKENDEYWQCSSGDDQMVDSEKGSQMENKGAEVEKREMGEMQTEEIPNESDMFTPVDVLICNGAYICSGEMKTMNHEDLMNTVQTNMCGYIHSMSKVIDEMKKKKNGLIIFINTEAALYPVYGFSFYAMSKSGMWTLTNILDQELKYYDIKIANAFLPSVRTPGFIKECLQKPLITAEIENMTNTLEPDDAANLIINEILKGKKFITADLNGFLLSSLHAGYRNPEAYFDLLVHVSFSGLFFFISMLYKLRVESIIRKHVVKEMKGTTEKVETDKTK